jgi:hypothetical protein
MAINPYLVSINVTQPTLASPTGTLYIVANAGDSVGPLTLEVPGLTPGIVSMNAPPPPGYNNYAYLQTGIPAGAAGGTSYQATIYDASPAKLPGFDQAFTIDPAPQQVLGCTDRDALNFVAGATADDGSCTYTPPPPLAPFFQVPALQSLRFAVRLLAGRLPTFDNLLFCEQPRPGQQVRPRYYQLVEFADVVRVQVLTSYTAIAATIYQHGGSQVGQPVPLTQVLTLEGPSAPLQVTLRDNGDGFTRLVATAGGVLPASLLGTVRLVLGGVASGTYRITQAVPASVVALDDYLVLNRPWVAPAAGQVTASWQLTGPGFNVWEATLPLSTLAEGYYQVKLRATAAGQPDRLAESEPIYLRAEHPDTLAIDYRAKDNCFNMVFATGITPRVRVWGTFFRQKNGGNLSSYTDSAADVTILSSTATRLTALETYGQPAYMHEKIFLACRLDYLAINEERHVSPAAYETSEVRSYALSGGHADLQKHGFLGAGNGDDSGDNVPGNALVLRGGGYLVLRGQ